MQAAVGTFEPVGREDGSEADTGMFRLFGRAVIADFRAATVGQYFALVLMVVVLAFEWGPGNEVVIVSTIARVVCTVKMRNKWLMATKVVWKVFGGS